MPPLHTLLLELAAALGGDRRMAIFGEGNVSARVDAHRLLVKASGTRLGALRPEQLVELSAAPLRAAVGGGAAMDDPAVEQLLLEARSDPAALRPSVESLFHAWLLDLPGVRFVGHAHPIAVNAVLCSPHKEAFARERLIPDQVVYCGAESVLVPYVDPGLPLAREIAARVTAFIERTGRRPKTILLENHGLIAVGAQPGEVAAAMGMAEKAARIYLGAAALGGPVFMAPEQVRRIEGRPDEHYRQRALGG